MYKTDCIFKLKLSNGRTVSLFLAGSSEVFATVPNGNIKHYTDMPVDKVYHLLQDAWRMAGISIVGITNHLIGKKMFWYSEKYDVIVTLKSMFQRDRPDLGDETHEFGWYLGLSKPIDEVADSIFYSLGGELYTDEFQEFLVSGIVEHGFQGNTPESSYSPTGEMFNRWIGNVVGKRVIMINRWSRDC